MILCGNDVAIRASSVLVAEEAYLEAGDELVLAGDIYTSGDSKASAGKLVLRAAHTLAVGGACELAVGESTARRRREHGGRRPA